MKTFKEPLYRKVNTKARGCHHNKGLNYREVRTSKNPSEKMKKNEQRGLDYTPLFKFLLSKVGQNFDAIFSEAKSRLDRSEPIFWMVREEGRQIHGENFVANGLLPGSFRVENSFFNTLYVDENNLLQKVSPELTVNSFTPDCPCCTHTFNGKPIPNKKEE